jgi:hypothetical protein
MPKCNARTRAGFAPRGSAFRAALANPPGTGCQSDVFEERRGVLVLDTSLDPVS